MIHADRNRRRRAKARRIKGRANRTKTGSARAQRRAMTVRRVAKTAAAEQAKLEVRVDPADFAERGLHAPVTQVAR